MPDPLRFELSDTSSARAVFGHRDEHLRLIAEALTVDISTRGANVTISGDPVDVETAHTVVLELYGLARGGHPINPQDVRRAAELMRDTPGARLGDLVSDPILVGAAGRAIVPKTPGQKRYVEQIRSTDVVFGVGPAGTGKTYLAMAVAVSMLLKKRVKRIVLTRPAVEAGERLGFLPGDLKEKVSPYLRPLYDALFDMVDLDRANQLIERGIIEVAPLAFMRGRTLNDAFVILDEAQNATRAQMKMFLTRLGFESKAVVTGDMTQIDLPGREPSGLEHAVSLLEAVPGIGVCRFSDVDVVRHPLVRRIIGAYERAEAVAPARGDAAQDDT
ncbi:MAG: PhoH family protein [Myxococcales bacterium]|nr:PhoH family protein [Myxococcales bacterium]MCB9520030.1 PhoH family protein [Myxococcales bacterium]